MNLRSKQQRIPQIGFVECRIESESRLRPVAVIVGGERIAINEIFEDAFVGSVIAGGPTKREIQVITENEEILILELTMPDGPWRIYKIMS